MFDFGENLGRVWLSRRIKILLGDRAFIFKFEKFRSIKKRKFY